MSGISDLDWKEIIDKYDINCNYDTLRKASQTIFGNYFVREYLKSKNITSDKFTLSDAKEVLGEQYVVKQQIHNDRLKLNKIKREMIPCLTVADELKQFMIDNDFHIDIPEYCHTPVDINSEHTMVCVISDWHIGYVINNCEGNYFNWEIANKRINKYISECKKYIKMYNIKNVIVINCGDTIENSQMRYTQDQYCEFLQAMQINKALELIYRFLCALCKDCNVLYGGIAGNHDRMDGDKKKDYEGNNANVIINEQLQVYKMLSQNERLSFIDTKYNDKEIRININGLSCKFVHGDNMPKVDKNTMANVISSDNELYDLLCYGHLHNFNLLSENNGRYIMGVGCLSGRNTYSKKFYCSTDASQEIIIIGNEEIELIKDINLSIN